MRKTDLGAMLACLLTGACGGQDGNPVDQTSNGTAGLSGGSGSPASTGGSAGQGGAPGGGQAGAGDAGAAGEDGVGGVGGVGGKSSGAGASGTASAGSAGSGGAAGGPGPAGASGQAGADAGGAGGAPSAGAAGASGGGQGGEPGGQAGGGPSDPITNLVLTPNASCARHASKKVSCWGSLLSSEGQFVTRGPTSVPGLEDITHLAMWDQSIYAVSGDGVVQRGLFQEPPEVLATAGLAALFAAWAKGASVRRLDGSLDGWDGPPSSDNLPIPITTLPPVDSLQGSERRICALAQGQVFCWGFNTDGECGTGTTSLSQAPGSPVVGLHDVAEVSLGLSWACARRPQKALACWGNNFGQSLVPDGPYAVTTPITIAGTEDAVQVTVGSAFACLLRSDGRVACFGANAYGSLGDPALALNEVRTTPTLVNGLEDVVEVAAGDAHVCARRQDGHVLCWGLNHLRQLGSDPSGVQPDGKLIYNPVPTEVVW